MNADNFSSFFRDPSRLYQLNYYELKSLVLQYPYCANLHQLLLEKSIMEDHPDLPRNLVRASVTSIDRPALRRRVLHLQSRFQPLDTLHLQGDDEVLELRELSVLPLSDTPGQLTEEPDTDKSPKREKELSGSSADSGLPAEGRPEEAAEPHAEQPSPGLPSGQSALESADDPLTQNRKSGKPQPNPKSSFASWVKQFQPSHIKVQLGEIMESEKRPSPQSARKKYLSRQAIRKVEQIAEQSITPSEETVSETLAGLLEKQGKYEEALAMYEKLQLKFPEKSAFFAAKIDAIKRM